MALLSEWMQKCGKNVLDNAGIVRDPPVTDSIRRPRVLFFELLCGIIFIVVVDPKY